MNKRWKVLLTFVLAIMFNARAQSKAPDSVVIRVGEASKVIFVIHDRKDLETLKHYDFQALMNDMIIKLEKKDTSQLAKPSVNYLKDTLNEQSIKPVETVSSSDNSNEDRTSERRSRRHWSRRTYHSFNVDQGTNNFLSNGKFPDQSNELYTVRPWGSWYIAFNSIQRTHVAGRFFLEWGGGVSWYNFKFQNDKTLLSKDNNGVIFSEDARDFSFLKSKLTATYLNVSFIPVIDFGGSNRKAMFFDGHHTQSFRFGVGPYAGYRIDSYTKQVYKDNGEKHRDHLHDNFYLNNFRYGMRLQIGFSDVDLFFNYDMNNLFAESKGPKLNAFSFGVTF